MSKISKKFEGYIANLSLNRKLIAFALTLSILPVSILGLYAYDQTQDYIDSELQEKLQEQVKLEKDYINATFSIAKERVRNNLNTSSSELYSMGNPKIVNGHMVIDGYIINNNSNIVNNLTEQIGGRVAIFQVTDNRAVKISESIEENNIDNLENESFAPDEMYKTAVIDGKSDIIRTKVQNEWYLNAYRPIEDSSNKVIGILCVGIPEKPFTNKIRTQAETLVSGKTGYVYVMNSDGKLIIHPYLEGENVLSYDFTQEMISKKEGHIRYIWEGRDKLVGYTYYEQRDWIIASGAFVEEFYAPLYAIRNSLTFVVLVFALLGSTIGIWFSRTITKPVNEMLEATNRVSEGDFDVEIKNTSKDEIGQLSNELNSMIANLKESNNLKDLFTDILRHDLLNPVTIIKGYTDVLLKMENDEKKIKTLETIKRNTDKLINMIENASKLTKLNTVEDLEFKQLDIGAIFKEVVKNYQPYIEEKQMNVDFRAEGEYPSRADSFIEDVFSNLLSNAVKYSPEGSKIIIDIHDAGKFWKVTVTDFGVGVADENKQLIFERFKRADKGGVKGSGLGLAIVKRIIELHGGDVGVKDNPEGQGSIFWVTVEKYQE
ncbi:MAG: Cache 3/Cache 2 fusion domain-containing protein [Methanohalobium sp.]|uniref:Cache 3/Cache 2 fusion domain-containing protein n=1 Tax=Methanohalobium sp. TaxID=2837493 RepID=UPI00397BD3F6